MMLKYAKHCLISVFNEDFFLLYQIYTRKGVLIEKSFLTENFDSTSLKNTYLYKDISVFSLSKTLVDNPNGIDNYLSTLEFDIGIAEDIISILKNYDLILSTKNYIERLGLKTSFFDDFHIGNFHQQIGEFVVKKNKNNSDDWWIYQKFNKDLSSTLDNPYKWVQEDFMNKYFTENKLHGKNLLDFGCGIGYYSKFFHSKGAKVHGVDPSKIYIDIAKKKFSKNKDIKFKEMSFENVSDFNSIKTYYDFIFLSDVFLYYFVPYKKIELTPTELLLQLKKKLKKDGKIFIIDPHGFFHLNAWFNLENPYIVVNEYSNRKYRVTPNLEELSIVFENAGLSIVKIRELKYKGLDNDKSFYKEFPFWWFFELRNDV